MCYLKSVYSILKLFGESFSLMLKSFGVSVQKHLIHLSVCLSIIAMILSNLVWGGGKSFYDGELWIFVKIMTEQKCCSTNISLF